MNTFTVFLGEYLVRSSLILLIGIACLAFINKSAPSSKHNLLLAVISLSTAFLFLTWTGPRIDIPPPPSSIPLITNHTSAASEQTEAPYTAISSKPVTTDKPSLNLTTILVSTYLLGFVLVIAYHAISTFYFCNLILKNRTKQIHRGINYYISPHINSPITAGILNVSIILPARKHTKRELDIILSHEMQHVIRKDNLTLHLSQIFLAIHWFNPLAWLINQKLEKYREEACDRKVIETGINPIDYAEVLYQYVRATHTFSRTPGAAAITHSNLEKRIKKILTMNNKVHNTYRTKSLFAIPSLLLAAICCSICDLKASTQDDLEAAIMEKTKLRKELKAALFRGPGKERIPREIIIAKAEAYLSKYPNLTLGEKVDIHLILAASNNEFTRSKSEAAANYDDIISDLNLTGELKQRILNEKLRNCYRLNPEKAKSVYEEIAEIDPHSECALAAKGNLNSILQDERNKNR